MSYILSTDLDLELRRFVRHGQAVRPDWVLSRYRPPDSDEGLPRTFGSIVMAGEFFDLDDPTGCWKLFGRLMTDFRGKIEVRLEPWSEDHSFVYARVKDRHGRWYGYNDNRTEQPESLSFHHLVLFTVLERVNRVLKSLPKTVRI